MEYPTDNQGEMRQFARGMYLEFPIMCQNWVWGKQYEEVWDHYHFWMGRGYR